MGFVSISFCLLFHEEIQIDTFLLIWYSNTAARTIYFQQSPIISHVRILGIYASTIYVYCTTQSVNNNSRVPKAACLCWQLESELWYLRSVLYSCLCYVVLNLLHLKENSCSAKTSLHWRYLKSSGPVSPTLLDCQYETANIRARTDWQCNHRIGG